MEIRSCELPESGQFSYLSAAFPTRRGGKCFHLFGVTRRVVPAQTSAQEDKRSQVAAFCSPRSVRDATLAPLSRDYVVIATESELPPRPLLPRDHDARRDVRETDHLQEKSRQRLRAR